MQAQSLRVLIDKGVTRDGYIGESQLLEPLKPICGSAS